MGALLRGTWRGGGSLTGDPVGYERKALETGISLHGGSVGQSGADISTVDFERWLKGALEVEFLSLYYGNLNNLSLCRPVLLSGNIQSEHVAAGKDFKQ